MAKSKKTTCTNPFLKAYDNSDFLKSPAGRNIRILTEMIEPADRLRRQRVFNTVPFFGSARTLPRATALKNLRDIKATLPKNGKLTTKHKSALAKAQADLTMSKYYEDARQLAKKMTLWFKKEVNKDNKFVICSGGGPGIMEAANRGAKEAKGESMGLNISLPFEQCPNPYQTKDISFEFHYFFIRKFWFFYLAKALVVFPGGFGTLDEMCELLTLVQTQKAHKHMAIVLYGSEYWNEVLNIKAMAKWGMISPEDLKLFKVLDTVDETFEFLKKDITNNYIKKSMKKYRV